MKKARYPIDLNADIGEGAAFDSQLMTVITSANIACGGHAGDQASMEQTVKLAIENQVKIGAHPSYPDKENFGRAAVIISDKQLSVSLYQQISSLKAICEALGVKLFHVKPHGALYNESALDRGLGQLLIDVIKQIDPRLPLMTLADSPLVQLAKSQGVKVIEEAFADRAYLADGTLAPRSMKGAVIETDNLALKQVENIIAEQPISTLDGDKIVISADSICLHGDNQHALTFARLIAQKISTAV